MGSIQEEQETNLPPPSWGVVFLHPEQRSDKVPRKSRFTLGLPWASGNALPRLPQRIAAHGPGGVQLFGFLPNHGAFFMSFCLRHSQDFFGAVHVRLRGGALGVLVAASILALPAAQAASLPDTGQDTCYNGTSMVACDSSNTGDTSTYPRQDGRYGRDPAFAQGAFAKTGGGQKGFDYTKLDASGNPLAIQNGAWSHDGSGFDNGSEGTGTKWSCVTDNVTELTWEVKTKDAAPALRDAVNWYRWYSSDASTNGGQAGDIGNDTCNGTLSGYSDQCNTQNYVAAVNAANLCGFGDWRLPSSRELNTLVHAGVYNPAIDSSYFPNMASNNWSSDTNANNAVEAWAVSFASIGFANRHTKSSTARLRLVRGGPF